MDTLYRAKPYIPEVTHQWILRKFGTILETGGLIQGAHVKEFEDDACQMFDVKNAVATTSCGTGLETVLIASGIKGKRFIVPTQTFAASVNCIIRTGNTPLIVDVDSETQCLSLDIIKENMTDDMGGVVLVHMSGLITPEMEEIEKYCKDNDLFLLTDDAHSYGAQLYNPYKDERRCAGTFGDAGVFSFYPSKIITTGEGGMITTNDDEIADRVSKLRNHGAEISEEQRHHGAKPYMLPDFNMLGFNYRMTDLQGALGVVQIKKLDSFISERNEWANYYIRELNKIDWLMLPQISSDYKPGWQSFVVFVDEVKAPFSRNEIMEKLQEVGISTRPGTHAVHMLNYYKELLRCDENDFPGAKAANDFSMSIPLHNRMIKEDYEYVVSKIKLL